MLRLLIASSVGDKIIWELDGALGRASHEIAQSNTVVAFLPGSGSCHALPLLNVLRLWQVDADPSTCDAQVSSEIVSRQEMNPSSLPVIEGVAWDRLIVASVPAGDLGLAFGFPQCGGTRSNTSKSS
jgi:hypothetical protein